MNNLSERIAERLKELDPSSLEIHDESERHRGHAGSSGGGHYRMTVVSERFSGLGLMARHRLVYGMLSDLMKSEIHALAIRAYTPSEYRSKQTSTTQ